MSALLGGGSEAPPFLGSGPQALAVLAILGVEPLANSDFHCRSGGKLHTPVESTWSRVPLTDALWHYVKPASTACKHLKRRGCRLAVLARRTGRPAAGAPLAAPRFVPLDLLFGLYYAGQSACSAALPGCP